MNTTLYLATDRGLAVVTNANERWRGSVSLENLPLQCVAVDPRSGIAYCGTFGHGMFRSEDGGRTWSALAGLKEPNVSALVVTEEAVYAGVELSAIYRSDDHGHTWSPLHTLMTMPTARTWSFPPRPKTHHVQAILPSLTSPARLHVAVEAGALLHSDDAGATWRDRIPGSPKDTHSLAVHPQEPSRLHSAAGDGYFESLDDGGSWQRVTNGLEHQYCWSVAVNLALPGTVLLSASMSAYGAHYKESAESYLYRRAGDGAWQVLSDGLPKAQGSRIAALASSPVEPATFYCSMEGGIYRSADGGLRWQELEVQWPGHVHLEHATNMAIAEAPSSVDSSGF